MFTEDANTSAGFLFLALFMLYGFLLVSLRDFARRKAQWIADHGGSGAMQVAMGLLAVTSRRIGALV